jgi:hypothetical protein
MVKMSSKNEIKRLEKLKNRILEEILQIPTMLPGSYNQVYCKCGKKNCWCYNRESGSGSDKVAHPFRRITWTEKGVAKTKAIPEKDVNWIKEVTENYRNFRKKCKEIQRLEKRIRSLLDQYGKDIVKKTRKLRKYL